ncbi:bifunctional methylenetetrahydrofolate dehydrogenase/methenyltetrahydrofolate cyclohydrolase [Vagococcus penaei]|uniref:Bifunctional protein FolD n=1 Tax=Vagococcus penaei TaxID=633807 RepID=A0A1Q2D7P1_9ENTE|nr:bifunctional methylenetetrahydrofolate dehydrogenase/methenyltetrahydrofolate cyclohydrolase FolD [Vagococcus penaei]AQP54408.1 bifunctional methylenetetrahydrofolate dehydrogenase/methenyltetrahydrofolate cyclohydrolase [Vagococcus penaei]RSU06325.1 bifunctional methylenetetrahydrofolate dehydrogenase/methenyltetrahydrofolate cyclohydrolase [Vagococcus penaei]
MAIIMNGRQLADQLQDKLATEVNNWRAKGLRLPTLAVILVGDDPASHVYVKNKEKAVAKIGFHSIVKRLPKETTEAELLEQVQTYNLDQAIDGILVQLPLPEHIDEEKVLLAIDAKKDVDGFHPLNMGKLFIGKPDKIACTPYGIITLLKAYDIKIEGKQVVVVGRSNIVGKPMAQLMLMEHGTVTLTHSRTKNLQELTQTADILVVAIGRGELITADYVKPGAIVIDVGMNRNESGKLVGDVDFASVEPVASFITPVPGGVGPMTITMLMEQTMANGRLAHLEGE